MVYLSKMNVMTIAFKANNNNIDFSSYVTESSYIWNSRLDHINYHILHRLTNLYMLLNVNINLEEKYEICVGAKMTKPAFYSIE